MIKQISYNSIRNLAECSIEISSNLCIFCGDNGAGKTSILESIHILGTGRSFRTHQISQVIEKGAEDLRVYAHLDNGVRIGVQRNNQNEYIIRINKETKQRLSLLAEYLPLRVMTPESFLLLTTGAQQRRQFLDFCVFHVEHIFAKHWQTYGRLIKQRNALLKQSKKYNDFEHWDTQIVPVVESINSLRIETFKQLIPYFKHYQTRFLPQYEVQYSLVTGTTNLNLAEQYRDAFATDRRYGYTTIGPHKADIRVQINNELAHQTLSRGELKMLIAAMILAQVKWLLERGTYCYLLLDDLVSELDQHKQATIFNEVIKFENVQTFITSIHAPEFFRANDDKTHQMFHVEHGVLSEQ